MISTTFLRTSTIFSLSSGFGKCGVAVVRVSGPKTKDVLHQMTSLSGDMKPRYAYYKSIHLPDKKEEILDKGLVLWFPGKNPVFFTPLSLSIKPPTSPFLHKFQLLTVSPAKTPANSKFTAERPLSAPCSMHSAQSQNVVPLSPANSRGVPFTLEN